MILEKSRYYANATINILGRANMIFQLATYASRSSPGKKRGRGGARSTCVGARGTGEEGE